MARTGKNGARIIRGRLGSAEKTPEDTGIAAMLRHTSSYGGNIRKLRNTGKPHVPTVEIALAVERAVGLGLTQKQISYLTGIGTTALNRHYKQELEGGGAILHASIAANLAAIALDIKDKRCVEAGKFILERKFGWKQNAEIDVKGGVNITQNVLDARALSPEDRGNLKELLLQAMAPALEDHSVQEAEYEEVDEDIEGLL